MTLHDTQDLIMAASTVLASGLLLYLLPKALHYKREARHFAYITDQLRQQLNAANDVLDKYTVSDATTTLAQRIEYVATRGRRRVVCSTTCLDCRARHTQQQAEACTCDALPGADWPQHRPFCNVWGDGRQNAVTGFSDIQL